MESTLGRNGSLNPQLFHPDNDPNDFPSDFNERALYVDTSPSDSALLPILRKMHRGQECECEVGLKKLLKEN